MQIVRSRVRSLKRRLFVKYVNTVTKVGKVLFTLLKLVLRLLHGHGAANGQTCLAAGQKLEGPEGASHNQRTSLGPCPSNESVPSRASELQRTRTLSSSPSGRDFGNALLTLLARLLALYVSCVVLLRIYQVRGGRGSILYSIWPDSDDKNAFEYDGKYYKQGQRRSASTVQ